MRDTKRTTRQPARAVATEEGDRIGAERLAGVADRQHHVGAGADDFRADSDDGTPTASGFVSEADAPVWHPGRVRREVRASRGTRWKVGRRWLVWRPQLRGIRTAGELTGHGLGTADLTSDMPFFLPVLLLLPVAVVVAVFLAEWLVLPASAADVQLRRWVSPV
jgi:hypothetical protein